MATHLSLTNCPICRRKALPLDLTVSYGIRCFPERIHLDHDCCPACGFVFQNNPLTRADLATYYHASPRYRSPEQNPFEHQLHLSQLQFMVDGGLDKGSTVLDIGADMGKLLDLAQDRHAAVTAYMEDSEFACAYLNGHGRHREIRELSATDRFDWIILSQVLEHIVEPVSFLRMLRDHLNPQGRIFIEVPCHIYWDDKDYGFSFEHVNYFSPTALSAALHGGGFTETHCEVGTDPRYFDGDVRFIRVVAQVLPFADSPLVDVVRNHHQRGTTARFERIRDLAARHKPNGRIAFYGAAELADLVLANTRLGKEEIVAIFDTDQKKFGTTFHELPIHSPADIPSLHPPLIVILSGAEAAIRETILKTGYTGQILGWGEL